MDYEKMGEKQLLELAAKEKKHNKEINKVWYGRYGINFPYRLSVDGIVKNMLINAFVGDRECDRLILNQANKIRANRGINYAEDNRKTV